MIRLIAFLFLAATLAVTFSADAIAHQPTCKPVVAQYGNLRAETYPVSCFSLTPFYWKNGVTRSGADAMLRRLGIRSISIIPGGFNTNLPKVREPVDYVEIAGKPIVGRSDSWPILFEGNVDGPYLGIVSSTRMLPKTRRWAIASGLWLRVKNGNGTEFTVEILGNDPAGTPWLEYRYRRDASGVTLTKRVDRKKKWTYVPRRLVFDWTERRAVLLDQDGTTFTIVKGRADAPSIGKLTVMLGYQQAIMMDGGSATASSARNPVYLAVTKK